MRLKGNVVCCSASKLRGSLIVYLIMMLILLEYEGVRSQDDIAAPEADADAAAAAADAAPIDDPAPIDPADAATIDAAPADAAPADAAPADARAADADVADTPAFDAPAADADAAPPTDAANAGTGVGAEKVGDDAEQTPKPKKKTSALNESLLLDQFQSKPIFGKNKCAEEMQCKVKGSDKSRVHTLCRELETPQCDRYKELTIFRVDAIKLIKLQEMIVSGHNGLRNRIAEKMKVGNMVELVWDDQLAQMTLAYYLQCPADVDDPCTQFVAPEHYEPQSAVYYEVDHFKWISQNRYNMKAEFFPTNFIEVALRSWYFEKDHLVKPTLENDEYMGITLGTLKGENNFVHMANPLSFRIGCSLAQIDQSFSLICNYYPFYRYINKNNVSEMTFISGQPAEFCPTFFPLKHEYFPNLCTDQFSKASEQISMSFNAATLLVIFWFFWL